jgi:hypothetical protein
MVTCSRESAEVLLMLIERPAENQQNGQSPEPAIDCGQRRDHAVARGKPQPTGRSRRASKPINATAPNGVVLDCADDAAAIESAQKYADGHDIEVWDRKRKVPRFPAC